MYLRVVFKIKDTSRVKQISSLGWMHEMGAQGWCTGKTEGWDGEGSGRGDWDGEHMEIHG